MGVAKAAPVQGVPAVMMALAAVEVESGVVVSKAKAEMVEEGVAAEMGTERMAAEKDGDHQRICICACGKMMVKNASRSGFGWARWHCICASVKHLALPF